MAIDPKHNALNVDQVRTITREVESDIYESATLVNDAVFEEMQINVIRDLENVTSLMVYDRKVGTTRRYEPGKPISSKLGYFHERELKVVLSWNRYYENIQNFREKAPFSILGSNETYSFQNTQTAFILNHIALQYSQDLLSNLFFGKASKGTDDPYGLYDGYFTLIENDINSGRISLENHNYQEIDPIDGTDPEADYDTAVKFYNNLDPKMKLQREILIYCSEATLARIARGYNMKFQGMQTTDVLNPSFRFFEMPKARFVTHAAMGEGDCMIATIPFNLDFGSDMNGAVTDGHIEMDRDQNDFNVLIFQIQTAQGTRIRRISSDVFCVSNGKNTPYGALGGEYSKDTLKAFANDSSMGSVDWSPKQEEYTEGDKVTLTATANEGFEFKMWADGATSNPRTYVYGGFPIEFEAVFQPKASEEGAGEEDEQP